MLPESPYIHQYSHQKNVFHGRYEYVSGFVVSLIIILMGIELFKASFEKIISPQQMTFHPSFLPFLSISAKRLLTERLAL